MLNFNWGFHYSLGLKQVSEMNQLLEFSKQVIASWRIRHLLKEQSSNQANTEQKCIYFGFKLKNLVCKYDLEFFRWQI